ncbi:hypothetical protein [Pseudomonas aeruginosa]|uniref:hypothetical protein n=1 Tax=Pseudomonas aeruginosa TaxID=287 RepID=UPI00071BC6B0|nr:hypothetical protein [Pseudomonas aeruginosa]KSP22690.1 hypothetical protein APB10_19345 [Pseudomonas aeruginosa]
MFQEFPKWKYSVSGSQIVQDAAEELSLGSGWFDTPEAAIQPVTLTKDQLLALAEEKGVKVDKRWSAEKISAALEA